MLNKSLYGFLNFEDEPLGAVVFAIFHAVKVKKKYGRNWSVLDGDLEEVSHKFYFSNLFPSEPLGK